MEELILGLHFMAGLNEVKKLDIKIGPFTEAEKDSMLITYIEEVLPAEVITRGLEIASMRLRGFGAGLNQARVKLD